MVGIYYVVVGVLEGGYQFFIDIVMMNIFNVIDSDDNGISEVLLGEVLSDMIVLILIVGSLGDVNWIEVDVGV